MLLHSRSGPTVSVARRVRDVTGSARDAYVFFCVPGVVIASSVRGYRHVYISDIAPRNGTLIWRRMS